MIMPIRNLVSVILSPPLLAPFSTPFRSVLFAPIRVAGTGSMLHQPLFGAAEALGQYGRIAQRMGK